MRFTAAAMVPTGDFLAHVGDWTGLPPADLLGLLRGSAPVSAGASDELGQLMLHREGRDGARKLLEFEDPPGQVLDAASCDERRAGAAAAAYLDLVGNRLLDGFDI